MAPFMARHHLWHNLFRVAFDSLGQKHRVFEPYRLSLLIMLKDMLKTGWRGLTRKVQFITF
jgi:hypothetical protein